MSRSVFLWGLVILVSVFLGYSLAGLDSLKQHLDHSAAPDTVNEPEILYWVAPMDPDFRRDGPGKSPMGMDLVPVYAKDVQSSSEASVRIDSAVQNNLGVRMAMVERRPLWRKVQATGSVGFDEDRLNRIHMRTEGWVEDLAVDTVGETVRRGQVLFRFYSPEVLNAQKEFLQSLSMEGGRMREAGREKLLALGMAPAAIDELAISKEASRAIDILAPMGGVLTALAVRDGMFLKPENEVLSLADLSSVWILAEVFETQADWVRSGQAAEARFNALPGEVFSGQLDYVFPVLDPMTRTLRVRLKFDNPGERLKPNMYARVTLFGDVHQDALAIPRDALIRAPEVDRVIISLGDGAFQGQEVMTGIESGDWVEIISGLSERQQVVTSAQFLLDSEASLTGAVRRLADKSSTEPARGSRSVFGTGVIEGKNHQERWLLIRHGPIEALGWPSMKMQFEVADEVELDRLSVGQNIHFTITPDEQGVYSVESVHLTDSSKGGDDD